jgi:BNR repeat-containing family member
VSTTVDGAGGAGGAEPSSQSSTEQGGTSASGAAGSPATSGGAPAAQGGGAQDAGAPQLAEPIELEVAEVWAGHPVQFALATTEQWQYVAYYDPDRHLTVAARKLTEDVWTYKVLPTTVGWDSHNSIAIAVDEVGRVHVSGNMHNVHLIYFRTAEPWDIASFEQVDSMVGRGEDSATYPEFFRGPAGNLIYAYRDGGSGNGNHILNATHTPSDLSRARMSCGTWSGFGGILPTHPPITTSPTPRPPTC